MLQMQKYFMTKCFRFAEVPQNIQAGCYGDRKNDSAIAFHKRKSQVILLDDAYQHRKVKLVLLTVWHCRMILSTWELKRK
jgi:hypothetical protein